MTYTYPDQALKVKPSEWFSNVPADLISGVVVALALIPEAIAFSIIAGLSPEVGLYASFAMTVTIACLGGRIAMISAATAAMALPLGGLVDLVTGGDEARLALALEYVLAATLVTGLLQVIWGSLQIGRIMKYVPRAVLVGFVNALAILIFLAQLEQFEKADEVGLDLTMYIAVAIGLGIIYLLPRLTKNISALKSIPSPLVAIVVLTVWTVSQGVALPTVGEMGSLPESLPFFRLPNLPFNFDTLRIVLPVALTLSGIGLLESFLTASVLDDMTDTNSDKNQEARGQGIANLVTGMFGGMAGCGMIGQSIINIKSGGRQRLSTLSAGVFLLFFVLALRGWVSQIPMAALVAVMFMVSISTFNWGSLMNLQRLPKSETAVMLATVVSTVLTENLAIGVLVGIALSAIAFSRKIGKLISIQNQLSEDGSTRTYYVYGQLFFVSANNFREAFNIHEKIERVVIDLTHAHLWDQSAVMAIDKVVLKFRAHDSKVKIVGMNEASATLMDKLAVHDKPDADKLVGGH
ncbi:MAG: SulP family inorganic anion transporter [Cyanobacteria bacterium J06560_6]